MDIDFFHFYFLSCCQIRQETAEAFVGTRKHVGIKFGRIECQGRILERVSKTESFEQLKTKKRKFKYLTPITPNNSYF